MIGIEPSVFLTFLPAALALNLTPGADMMFCVNLGLRGGVAAAWLASAGVALGLMVHVTIAGLGLGAVVAKWPVVFDAVRWVGVVYLLWLALRILRGGAEEDAPRMGRLPQAFTGGLIVNLTNPKVILFVLAFIPQFVNPNAGTTLQQFLVFGAVLGLGGLIVNGLAGSFAGGVGQRVGGSRRMQRGLQVVTASIFGLLALRLVTMKQG